MPSDLVLRHHARSKKGDAMGVTLFFGWRNVKEQDQKRGIKNVLGGRRRNGSLLPHQTGRILCPDARRCGTPRRGVAAPDSDSPHTLSGVRAQDKRGLIDPVWRCASDDPTSTSKRALRPLPTTLRFG